MPSFQGVEIAIATEPGSKKLPEFPLSSSSSQNALPSTSGLFSQDCNKLNSLSALQQAQKQSPRISVYIPSEPGTHFGIHYTLAEVLKPPPYLYFKIFMNGRNVANCGAKCVAHASGSIVHSLSEPSERWKYKEDGVLYIRDGIEARRFCFLPAKNQSVAEEGGFIEVQIFRSKGRVRRLPVLEKHRGQEAFGIGRSPSGGLLDSPEDACYYDWVLIDPKEFPFVTFRFHYRTWSNLYQLSLAPRPTEPEESLTRTERDSAKGPIITVCANTKSCEKDRPSLAKRLSSEDQGHVVLYKTLSSLSQSHLSGRFGGLVENAPVILPPNHSTRPLPEIPTKRPVAYKDCEHPVLAYMASDLSDISEKTEDSRTSTTATFPARSSSLRNTEHRILESHETENTTASSTV
ncbi:hypothetical protein ACLX1H_005677 [Fusarium chlamydosporum]